MFYGNTPNVADERDLLQSGILRSQAILQLRWSDPCTTKPQIYDIDVGRKWRKKNVKEKNRQWRILTKKRIWIVKWWLSIESLSISLVIAEFLDRLSIRSVLPNLAKHGSYNSMDMPSQSFSQANTWKLKKLNFKKCPSSKPLSPDFGNVEFSISLKLCEQLCGILRLSQTNLSFWQKFHNLQFTVGALSKTWRRVELRSGGPDSCEQTSCWIKAPFAFFLSEEIKLKTRSWLEAKKSWIIGPKETRKNTEERREGISFIHWKSNDKSSFY